MPSMPILRIPAFSEICSPRPASSKGTPAVTAPKISVLRKASVRSALTVLGLRHLPAAVIEEIDQSEEQKQHADQERHEILRHADPSRRAFAADHQHREEQRI